MVLVTARKTPGSASSPEASEIDDLPSRALLEIDGCFPTPGGRERLLQCVSAMPERYAPFFSRLGRMWFLDEAGVDAALRECTRRGWRRAWPGIQYMDVVGGGSLRDARARLLRFEPGVRLPAHRHRGDEEVLVLEGSYTDSTGKLVGAGDCQLMMAGSEHALVVSADQPCVAAVVQRGLSFIAPWARRFRRLLRK